MARRAIPMIAFPWVRTIYIYIILYIIYILVSPTRVLVVYVVKEVTSSRGLGQLMGVAHKRTRDQALQIPAERKLCSLRTNWNK